MLIALSLLLSCAHKPVENASEKPVASKPLPVDPQIVRGQLDNGLKYFIEVNKKPKNRAVLRLAVDAGSLLEDDDQQGLAHFLEHMAFNGTDAYPGNELISYLESVGTKFGAHLNAHTSFDETVYKLTIPTDDKELFHTGLDVLKQWSCCFTLDPAEIEKERGVVLEEWRLREGLGERIKEQTAPLYFHDSRYAERYPIGTGESLRTFEPESVERYYRQWYRPDLMAVVVVGDVDPEEVKAQIEELFSVLKNPDEERERSQYKITAEHEPLFKVVTDKELTYSSVQRIGKFHQPHATTEAQWRQREIEGLFASIANERLKNLAQDATSPFMWAVVGMSQSTPFDQKHTFGVGAEEGKLAEAYEFGLHQIKRLADHGVTADELLRAKAGQNKAMQRYASQADTVHSVKHADEIVRHFLNNEPMPGTLLEAELSQRMVKDITIEEINSFAKQFLVSSEGQVTVAYQPEKDGLEKIKAQDLMKIEQAVKTQATMAPVAEQRIERLALTPEKGTFNKVEGPFSQAGFSTLIFENGLQLHYRKTDFTANEISITGYRDGGMDSVPEENYVSAKLASSIRASSGLNGHSPEEISRYLTEHTASASVGIGGKTVGLRASSGTEDFPVALTLMNLLLTKPEFTQKGEERALHRWQNSLLNNDVHPDSRFRNTWNQLFWPKDPRKAPLKPEDLSQFNLETSREIWKSSVGSPEEWQLVVIGDLPDDFEEQVATWLGSLPKAEPGFKYVDRGFWRQPKERREVLAIGSAERAHYRTEWWIKLDKPLNSSERVRLSALRNVLSVRLRERLREDLGGVYGVSVWPGSWRRAYPGLALTIDFQCDPSRLEELTLAMEEELADFVKNPVDIEYIERYQATSREAHEDALRSNGYWSSVVMEAMKQEEPVAKVLQMQEEAQSVTAKEITTLAKQILSSKNRGTLVLLPKEE